MSIIDNNVIARGMLRPKSGFDDPAPAKGMGFAEVSAVKAGLLVS
jgi:hypothetical protein